MLQAQKKAHKVPLQHGLPLSDLEEHERASCYSGWLQLDVLMNAQRRKSAY